MKSDAERGRWGRFLRAERMKRHLSQDQVRERMLKERAFAIGESSYAEWESGYKQPSREAQAHFTALWKAQPEPEAQRGSTEPTGDVAAAIREQTEVMRELMDELRASRNEPPAWVEALVAALVASPAGPGTAASDARPAPSAPRTGPK